MLLIVRIGTSIILLFSLAKPSLVDQARVICHMLCCVWPGGASSSSFGAGAALRLTFDGICLTYFESFNMPAWSSSSVLRQWERIVECAESTCLWKPDGEWTEWARTSQGVRSPWIVNSLNWMAVLNGAEAALLVAACLAVHHRQALVYDFMTLWYWSYVVAWSWPSWHRFWQVSQEDKTLEASLVEVAWVSLISLDFAWWLLRPLVPKIV